MSKKLKGMDALKVLLNAVKCKLTAVIGELNVFDLGFALKALLIVFSGFSPFTLLLNLLPLCICTTYII